MTDYSFYADEYAGNSIPQCEWPTVQRDASAKVARYERIYTVTWLEPTGRDMAVCAIADAMYAFAQLQAEGGAVQSASVGSVSERPGHVARGAGTGVLPLPVPVCRRLQGVLIC